MIRMYYERFMINLIINEFTNKLSSLLHPTLDLKSGEIKHAIAK